MPYCSTTRSSRSAIAASALATLVLGGASCGSAEDPSDDPQEVPVAPSAAPVPVAAVEPAAPSPPPAPEPTPDAVVIAEADVDPPEVARPTPESMALAPAFDVGDRFGRRVDWSSISDVDIEAGEGGATARIETVVESTYAVRVTSVAKGTAATLEVSFERFERRDAGERIVRPEDPAVGDVWSCRVDALPHRCATTEDVTLVAPPWLALSFDALMPARFVRPDETWSRRVGVAESLGLPPRATARATLRAEAPYQSDESILSTIGVTFDADTPVEAFGREVRIRGTGEAAMEFDLTERRVVAFDSEWQGVARARSRANDQALSYVRSTTVTLRVTDVTIER